MSHHKLLIIEENLSSLVQTPGLLRQREGRAQEAKQAARDLAAEVQDLEAELGHCRHSLEQARQTVQVLTQGLEGVVLAGKPEPSPKSCTEGSGPLRSGQYPWAELSN